MANQQYVSTWQHIRPWMRRGKRLLEALAQPLFHLRGAKAHSFGYNWHKQRKILDAINLGEFSNLKVGYGKKIDERIIELPWFFSRIAEGPERMLDAGSALNHKDLLSHPLLTNKNITISTLAPESDAWWRTGISYVYEDFRSSCFRDGYFDSIACISTLEHVGLDNTMLYTGDSSKKENTTGDAEIVIAEFRRMLRAGGRLYLTFPFGKHHNYGWFQVFDKKGVETLAKVFNPTQRHESYFKYSNEGWERCSSSALEDADYFDPHSNKSELSADGAAGARGVACLEWHA